MKQYIENKSKQNIYICFGNKQQQNSGKTILDWKQMK